jgi:hypothetical protein
LQKPKTGGSAWFFRTLPRRRFAPLQLPSSLQMRRQAQGLTFVLLLTEIAEKGRKNYRWL